MAPKLRSIQNVGVHSRGPLSVPLGLPLRACLAHSLLVSACPSPQSLPIAVWPQEGQALTLHPDLGWSGIQQREDSLRGGGHRAMTLRLRGWLLEPPDRELLTIFRKAL